MGHRYQKGARRMNPGDKPKGGGHGQYVLSGGIPWPELGDGTPWCDGLTRVTHAELTQETGTLQWVEWCHPDGERMPDGQREKVRKATKTLPERRETNPGAWWAVVSWDRRDQHDSLMARHPLMNLRAHPLLDLLPQGGDS